MGGGEWGGAISGGGAVGAAVMRIGFLLGRSPLKYRSGREIFLLCRAYIGR
jgi:hypothetical protein